MLEKLQIVQIESKDIIDVAMLLSDHPVGSGGKDIIDKAYIARLLAADWGFYYTVTTNRSKISEAISQMPEIQQSDKQKSAQSQTLSVEIRVIPQDSWFESTSARRR